MIKQKKLTHSKIKNTGILFELLVRQVISDILNKKESNVPKTLLEKFFCEGTEINKEYKIYSAILNLKNKKSQHIRSIITEALNYAKNIDIKKLKKEKYNLIKEINETYDNEYFFKTQLPDFKIFASTYKLLTLREEKNIITEIGETICIKENLIQCLENSKKNKPILIKKVSDEKYVKNQMTFKLMVEKFNEKYKHLNDAQKEILKLYAENSITSKLFIDKLVILFNDNKQSLRENKKHIKDKAIKIKVEHVTKKIDNTLEKIKSGKINEAVITDALLFNELVEEINKLNKN